jgi:hypothetical protein
LVRFFGFSSSGGSVSGSDDKRGGPRRGAGAGRSGQGGRGNYDRKPGGNSQGRGSYGGPRRDNDGGQRRFNDRDNRGGERGGYRNDRNRDDGGGFRNDRNDRGGYRGDRDNRGPRDDRGGFRNNRDRFNDSDRRGPRDDRNRDDRGGARRDDRPRRDDFRRDDRRDDRRDNRGGGFNRDDRGRDNRGGDRGGFRNDRNRDDRGGFNRDDRPRRDDRGGFKRDDRPRRDDRDNRGSFNRDDRPRRDDRNRDDRPRRDDRDNRGGFNRDDRPRRDDRGGRRDDFKKKDGFRKDDGGFKRDGDRRPERKDDAPKPVEPELPESGVDPSELDPEVRRELLSLPKGAADKVAQHLVAAGQLIDEDPERALAHARFARQKASRTPSVREANGLTAYLTGEWNEALSELRAARRMGGGPGHLAIMADCERAMGRPERAIELVRSEEALQLDKEDEIELRIVAAGARRDLDEIEASVVSLQIPELDPKIQEPWSARLFYAYADNLLAAGRERDAFTWFVHAAHADDEEETDAPERLEELAVQLGGPEVVEELVNEAEAAAEIDDDDDLDEDDVDGDDLDEDDADDLGDAEDGAEEDALDEDVDDADDVKADEDGGSAEPAAEGGSRTQ